ncbi:MAG: LOG family protein, partial [Candidatus Binatia bacterium]
ENVRPARRRARRSPALERIEAFLREIKPEATEPEAQYVREMILTALRLIDDGTSLADLKLLNASLRELRYAFRVFARYDGRRKVTTFGSARTAQNHPEYEQAKRFSQRIAEEGFMVITGAGGGIMRACQEGAGRERSFGVNIRLPFEQLANEFIVDDPKLVNFKYFFTRKLLFVKEADAIAFFPGGFGTHDEAYESLTLVQTGKTLLVPLVFVDAPGGGFWKDWERSVRRVLLARGLISEEDLSIFRVTDDAEEAVQEILGFYRVYNSSRFVGEKLVLRLNRRPEPEVIERLNEEFADLVLRGQIILRGAFPEERGDEAIDRLPRLAFHFNRVNYGRLRQMIDVLNRAGSGPR